jgi:hypothetical protein
MNAEWVADLEMELDTRGGGKILVDGKDISNRIYKVELTAEVDDVFHAVMYMRVATVKVHGSGMVGMKTLTVDGPGKPYVKEGMPKWKEDKTQE